MIESMSSWAQNVIVSVIIATIIEMILPDGNNKKYIKLVLGVYILFAIISPILKKVTNKNVSFAVSDYEEYFKNTNTYTYISDDLIELNDTTTKNLYISNLEVEIRGKIVAKGYMVKDINIIAELENEEKYGEIKQIKLNIEKGETKNTSNNNISIEKVKIGNSVKVQKKENNLTIDEIKALKDYLSQEYEMDVSVIHINAL